MRDDGHELPPEILALLEQERAAPSPLEGAEARLWARIAASATGTGSEGEGGPAEPGSSGGVPAESPSATAGPVASAATPVAMSAATKPLTLALTFALGAASGAALHAVAVRDAGPVADVTSEVPVPPPDVRDEREGEVIAAAISSPDRVAIAPDAAPDAGVAADAGHVARRPPAAGRTPASRPGQESAMLLERARAAVARGRGEDALAALAVQRLDDPGGRYAEERQALEVQALVSLGRRSEASRRARAFAHHFPESIFLPVVEAAVMDRADEHQSSSEGPGPALALPREE
jgi:hypothetical protein